MSRKILAIGGSVIKTARPELKRIIDFGDIEILIHNGGSIFHDFQISIDKNLSSHSYPIDDLLKSYECNREASEYLSAWFRGRPAPVGSATKLCEERNIKVLMFTGLACDFWQLFEEDWNIFSLRARKDFYYLCDRFKTYFHYICMGSAAIHPEVFLKAIAVAKPKNFRADVVDFLDVYRPRTRVAIYGKYYKITHKKFFDGWKEYLSYDI